MDNATANDFFTATNTYQAFSFLANGNPYFFADLEDEDAMTGRIALSAHIMSHETRKVIYPNPRNGACIGLPLQYTYCISVAEAVSAWLATYQPVIIKQINEAREGAKYLFPTKAKVRHAELVEQRIDELESLMENPQAFVTVDTFPTQLMSSIPLMNGSFDGFLLWAANFDEAPSIKPCKFHLDGIDTNRDGEIFFEYRSGRHSITLKEGFTPNEDGFLPYGANNVRAFTSEQHLKDYVAKCAKRQMDHIDNMTLDFSNETL